MKTNRTAHIAAVGALGIGLVLTGCSGSSDETSQKTEDSGSSQAAAPTPTDDQEPTAQESEDAGEKTASPLAEDADLSEDSPSTSAKDAVKTAEDKVNAEDGTLHAVELDYDSDDGKWEYDVKIMDGKTDHKIVIDADSGKVVRDESESSDDTEKAVDLESPMTFEEAYDLAKKKGSGRLSGWKLEYDDGQREYQFDFDDNGSETEVTVNVDSKKVTVD